MLDTIAQETLRPPRLQRARGVGRITAKARDGRSVIDTLYQEGCAKIRVPKPQGTWLDAVLINSSGGLTGGDGVLWSAEASQHTHLVVTTQACERVYRSVGGSARVSSKLTIDKGARLDWLPQETILFDGAELERRLDVEMAADATFLGLEAVIMGREARGEDALSARLKDDWRVRRGGVLVHAEASRLDANCLVARNNVALLYGARAYATLCYVAADAERQIGPVKALLEGAENAGASRIGEKLVVRILAESGYRLRKIIMPVIAQFAGAVPKLWTL
ncbi:urease accessory protein UreD [Pelagibacterium limicola]|uniref:urease accessory protein UreD n=1 Tax=Pelagibacterium limicola TaxID=2791022 RepID=UPI0018AFF0CA|nr:urease accessory protein UreD [Pelagibacterium limicola]